LNINMRPPLWGLFGENMDPTPSSFFGKLVTKLKDPIFIVYAPIFVIYVFVSTFGAYVVELWTADNQHTIRILFLASVSIVTGVLLIFGVRHAYRRAIRQNVRVDYGFPEIRLVSIASEFEIKPKNIYHYKKWVSIKSATDNQRYFNFNFGYTGAEKNIQLMTCSANVICRLIKNESEIGYTCAVEFVPPLRKNEIREFSYVYEINDAQHLMGKFFCYICSFPVENYTSHLVRFPTNIQTRDVDCFWQTNTFSTKRKKIDPQIGANSISFTIKDSNLKVGGKYLITWK
jgi:hypothetical protein